MTKESGKKVSLTKESIIKEANAEIQKEFSEKYKKEYKALVRNLANAQQVVRNIEAEMADLELKMEQELG